MVSVTVDGQGVPYLVVNEAGEVVPFSDLDPFDDHIDLVSLYPAQDLTTAAEILVRRAKAEELDKQERRAEIAAMLGKLNR